MEARIEVARDPKPFLDYLDKEMTIMGILSGFCIAALALIVDKIAGAKDSTSLSSLWASQSTTWVIGAGALLVAALFFYRQRSYLAWHYGQITLAQATGDKGGGAVQAWLRDADSWETWLFYRDGFAALSFAFVEFSVAVIHHERGTIYPRILTLWLPLVSCLTIAWLQRYVLTRYRFHDEPWRDWWKRIKPAD